jgi:release factor glutamine methyltransferase
LEESVYPPGEDSQLLLEVALMEIKDDDEVLEVGTGSGYVAACLKGHCREIVTTDISPLAVKSAKREGLEVIRTDLFTGICRKFSLILFNPPYLELEDWEKRGDWLEKAIDGGKGGIEVLTRFITGLRQVMSNKGRAIVIVSSHTSDKVFRVIREEGFDYRIMARKKLFFEELYAVRIGNKSDSTASL